MRTTRVLAMLVAVLAIPRYAGTAEVVSVSLVLDGPAGEPSRYAFEKLKVALAKKEVRFEEAPTLEAAKGQVLVAAGLPHGRSAATLIKSLGVAAPAAPESLLIRNTSWNGKPVVLVSGADERGLMYGLLDVADRVSWTADGDAPFQAVRDAAESPAVADRGMTIFTMQQAQFENRLHNEDYWAKYLDTLAEERFNTFQLLFAYDMNGYMCPAYPYFLNVEQFPEVAVTGMSAYQQQRNQADLKRLIRMAHQRGLNVTIGLWCHFYRYSGSTKSIDRVPVKGKVWGVTSDNLIPYTKVAMAKFLQTFPEIDNMMFLMHGESGLKAEEMKAFWSAVFPVLKQYGPRITYEFRAKGVPDDLIHMALDLGLKVRVNTKYWEEHAGLPFHPTHVQKLSQFERRHSYSDMLRYPRDYPLHYTLWTAGTMRVLLWGDPEYVRRFAGTVSLGGSKGFDVMEPLATKMSFHPHDMQPFDLMKPQYRYYDYEFERYWHFFQVFGRLTYNPNASPEIWQHEFVKRFGEAAAPYVEQGLHRASQILPHIEAYVLPSSHFPNIRGWAERQIMEDLPEYVKADPSDTEQFRSFEDAAVDILEGRESAQIPPLATSRWFARASEDVLNLAGQAGQHAGPQPGKELNSTLVDLRILGNLALYHSRRIRAGLSYVLFNRTRDLNALDDAITSEKSAIAAWEEIVRAAGDVYADDLMMGLPANDESGHWRDQIPKLQKDLAGLEQQRAAFRPEPPRVVGKYFLGDGSVPAGFTSLSRGRGNTFDQNLSNVAIVSLPNGRYLVNVAIQDDSPAPKDYGPMWLEANGMDYTDVFTVPAGQRVERTIETSVTDGKLEVLFDTATSANWYGGALSVTSVDPQIAHIPVRRLSPTQDLVLRATVSAVSPIAAVRVVFGNAHQGYANVDMERTQPLEYRVVIPAASISNACNYFIEAVDEAGRVATWPQQGRAHPISVMVTADDQAPVLHSTPVLTAQPLKPLRIVADVQDPSGIKWVRLRYRGLSQHQDFRTLPMLPTSKGNEWEAVIPAKDIDPTFDLMYLFEVMDNAGNGKIYPDLDKETPYVVVKIKQSQ